MTRRAAAAITFVDPCPRGHFIPVPEADAGLTRITDLASLGTRWRALEGRSDGGFFRGWTWVGCLAAERFDDPVLLALRIDGEDVALALCNRRGTALAPDTLWLGESGRPDLDTVYVEHNGPLIAHGHAARLGAVLRTLLRAPIDGRAWPGYYLGRRLVLAGVGDDTLRAAREGSGLVRVMRSQPAPWVDFTRLGDGAEAFLDSLSANARYQVRRSNRRHEALGLLAVHRADSVPAALAVLDELAELHQATWSARGQPGAFASPFFRRFHRELIARGMPGGEVDLLRITAGDQLIGCLYNFREHSAAGSRVLAYQSGFNYAAATAHQRPGLTCHHLAIEMYRRLTGSAAVASYDFLAGEGRYKSSFANMTQTLHWLDLTPSWSPRGLLIRGAGRFIKN